MDRRRSVNYACGIDIEYVTLSDGSVASNVLYTLNGVATRFGCLNEKHATDLAEQLMNCAWAAVA